MTPAAMTHPSGRLHDALEPWCAVGSTGTLRLLDPPGGAVYLVDGRISYAECPPACGLDRLLTASGRLSAEAWRAALVTGRANRQVGETLLRGGLLGPAELESLVLSAVYGALHFLFELDSEARFEMGAGHPLGPVVALDLRTACLEVERRRRMLADAWPDPKLDTHAVLPARRLPGHHVTLTGLQWEIVANADRRRTPIELARSLGRDTFATLLEVRRLARAGLVEPGRPGSAAWSSATAGGAAPGAAGGPATGTAGTPATGTAGGPATGAVAATGGPAGGGRTASAAAPLPGGAPSAVSGGRAGGRSDPRGRHAADDSRQADPAGRGTPTGGNEVPPGSGLAKAAGTGRAGARNGRNGAGTDSTGTAVPGGLRSGGEDGNPIPDGQNAAPEGGDPALEGAADRGREVDTVPLPRREVGTNTWFPAVPNQRSGTGPDEAYTENTLVRIRNALEALR